MIKNKEGFSLVEVLIFVSIMSVFFVVAIGIATASLRNMQFNQHKIIATKYAEDLVEWLRSEKETDWNVFTSKASGTYCFNASPIAGWPAGGSCSSYDINSLYKRSVVFTSSAVGGLISTVNVAVTVEWTEGGNIYKVPINTLFTLYE